MNNNDAINDNELDAVVGGVKTIAKFTCKTCVHLGRQNGAPYCDCIEKHVSTSQSACGKYMDESEA